MEFEPTKFRNLDGTLYQLSYVPRQLSWLGPYMYIHVHVHVYTCIIIMMKRLFTVYVYTYMYIRIYIDAYILYTCIHIYVHCIYMHTYSIYMHTLYYKCMCFNKSPAESITTEEHYTEKARGHVHTCT